jgi:hypothetical protein
VGGCLFQWCTVALYPNVLVVSIKKNRRRDWFGFGDGAAWGLVWFAADLFVDYHDLLISRVVACWHATAIACRWRRWR